MSGKKTIHIQAKILTTLIEKSIGLLGAKKIEAVVISTRFGIHTFGMHTPIDLVLLDHEQNVVSLWENVMPFRVVLYSPKYKTMIELPKGSIKRLGITLSDVILISPC